MTQNQPHEITCIDCQTQIEEYLAGELDSTAESAMASHLANCDSCQHELRLAQTIDTVLNELPIPTTPPAILQEVTAYIQKHPKQSSWIHRFGNLFDWGTPRQLVLRVCTLACLVGIALFGIHQHKKHVLVAQAKSDFNYAMSKMQYALNRTGMAVNDSFRDLKIDEAPRRALKSTTNISSAIDRSLGILNRLTGDVTNSDKNTSQTKSPTDWTEEPNSPIQTPFQGGNTQ